MRRFNDHVIELLARQGVRMDAAETAFFERELMHVYTRTYDKRYPDLKARQFVPVSTEAGSGATSVNFRQWDRVGKAAFISQRAKDLPRVDVFAKEFIRPVRPIGDSFGYDLLELRQAAMAGKSLDAMRGMAARRAIEELLDFTACFGAPDYGIPDGFLNNTDVPVTGAGGHFETLSADQIIAEAAGQRQRIQAASLGTESPNTWLLPMTTEALLRSMPRSSVSDTTVASFIEKEFGLKIYPWYRLETAGAGGTKRAVMYDNSPEKLQQEIASEFEMLPVQPKGLDFEVPCIAVTAGTALYYPKGIDFLDNI